MGDDEVVGGFKVDKVVGFILINVGKDDCCVVDVGILGE